MDKTVIVGLGNPGSRYEFTRHNAGFMTIDALAEKYAIGFRGGKFDAFYGQGMVEGKPVFLLKPQTFMNLSGRSVRALLSFYQIPIHSLVVISDDFAIPMGTMRFRAGGSDGGHNGLSDIAAHLGTNSFARLRIGVGPLPPHMSSPDFVLSVFSPQERKTLLESVIPNACRAIGVYLTEGIDAAMNVYNRTVLTE